MFSLKYTLAGTFLFPVVVFVIQGQIGKLFSPDGLIGLLTSAILAVILSAVVIFAIELSNGRQQIFWKVLNFLCAGIVVSIAVIGLIYYAFSNMTLPFN